MSFKEILFNIIIPLISGIIGGGISSSILIKNNINKKIMKNKNVQVKNGDIVNGNKQQENE